MTEVKFYENIEAELLKFAVIFAKTQNKYVFCKHKDRDTWEVPGGHRENGENIMDTAKRELYEETGALEFDIEPICIYSVTAPDNLNHGEEVFGMLFFADIKSFEAELHCEIEKIIITDKFPERWTYPYIQPRLIEEAEKRGYIADSNGGVGWLNGQGNDDENLDTYSEFAKDIDTVLMGSEKGV